MDEMLEEDKLAYYQYMWEIGRLEWLCFDYQDQMYKDLYRFFDTSPEQIYVVNCSRRFGKTTVLIIIAMEHALRAPNQVIRFAMPYQKEAKGIVRVAMRDLLSTCPSHMRPKWHSQDSYWSFPNGSELHISGVNNNNEDNLRGHKADLAIVDEAGQCDNLHYLVVDILRPQLLTTYGKMVVASTPPPTPGHYYKTMYDVAKSKGVMSEYNVYENTHLSTARLAKEMEDAGGEDSNSWQREYLVQFVVDLSVMVMPEWKNEYVQEFKVGRQNLTPHYQFFHKYAGLDLGVINDFTAGVFGYYNFEEDKFYVEGEITSIGQQQSTGVVYGLMSAKEQELGYKEMRLRVADNNNPQLIQDMTIEYDYNLMPVSKKTLQAMVNNVRMNWINKGRLIIHPSCNMTIGCLERAYWKVVNERTKTSRQGATVQWGKDAELGHFDHLAALMYLLLNIDTHSNPVPYLADWQESDSWLSDKLKTNTGNSMLEHLSRGIRGKK